MRQSLQLILYVAVAIVLTAGCEQHHEPSRLAASAAPAMLADPSATALDAPADEVDSTREYELVAL